MPRPEPPRLGGFADVDGTGSSGEYAAYLDGVRGLAAVAEWKERSLALLEPRPGLTLLDLGCGTGEDVVALAERVAPGGRALGIDASESMIAEARRRARGAADFHVGDVRRLELADASTDGCRAERTLQHLERPAEAVREMARVVRPGGWIVVAEPDWATLVVDPGDPGVGREVAAAAGDRLRSGTVGRSLRRLLVDAGLVEVGVAARALILTDRARAERVLGLEAAATGAVRDGRVTADSAARWRAELTRADAEGRYLAAMTSFMAWARRRP